MAPHPARMAASATTAAALRGDTGWRLHARHHRTALPRWSPRTIAPFTRCPQAPPRAPRSDTGAEAAGGANGGRLAHVRRAVQQRDTAQHRRPRPPGECLDDHLGAAAERALVGGALHARGRDRPLPIGGLEAADDLARAAPDCVAVL